MADNKTLEQKRAERAKFELPNEVASKYELTDRANCKRYHIPGYGSVDFSKITLSEADKLVAKTGNKFLKSKQSSKIATTTTQNASSLSS